MSLPDPSFESDLFESTEKTERDFSERKRTWPCPHQKELADEICEAIDPTQAAADLRCSRH